MEACYGGTDVIERSCAVARGIDINIGTLIYIYMVGWILDTTNLGPGVGRRSCFVPLAPELTISFCSTASAVPYCSCLRAYMHIRSSVFIRSTGILIQIGPLTREVPWELGVELG